MDNFKLKELLEQAMIDKHKIDDINFSKFISEAQDIDKENLCFICKQNSS
jgi:hypothetical protein